MKKTLGFTLIELLVSVSILTILSGAVIRILNTSGIQGKARDSQRISDLKKIQVALELYFADKRTYYTSSGRILITGSDALSSALKTGGYLFQVPSDPVNSGVSPCATGAGYTYRTDNNGAIYVLTAGMEVATSDDKSTCASLSNWNTLGCGSVPETVNCYGVRNP
jgi:prepilin-type N-terminal cleavage/methylation domain-containing protein